MAKYSKTTQNLFEFSMIMSGLSLSLPVLFFILAVVLTVVLMLIDQVIPGTFNGFVSWMDSIGREG